MAASRVGVVTVVTDGGGEAEKQLQLMVKTCEVNLNGVQMTMAQTQMPHDQLHSMTLVYEWNIRDIKRDEDGGWNGTRESEVFPLTGYHYGAKANIETNQLIHLQLIDYNQTKRLIDTRSMPKVTYVIMNQSERYKSHDYTQDRRQLDYTQLHSTDGIRTGRIEFKQSVEYGKDIYSRSYISHFIRYHYLDLSNRMMIKVYIEPPSIARTFFSNDGILLWRLDNYKKRWQMERDGLIMSHESPYFYTSPQGYRVLVTLHFIITTPFLQGVIGELSFVKGEFDSTLTPQFPHRLTMTIFNHTDQSKNLVLSVEGKEADSTLFEFESASASLLESGGYVANDSLLIKAVVEPL